MSSPSTTPPTPTLAEIVAAQTTIDIFAFDRAESHRELARLQRLYAAKLREYDEMNGFFNEGVPDITLHLPTHQLTLRLGSAIGEIRPILRQAFDQQLRQLEEKIVQAHLALEQEKEDEANRRAPQPDTPAYYVPSILALCTPRSVPPSSDLPAISCLPAVSCRSLSREEIARREAAAHARADAEAAFEFPNDPGEQSRAAHELGALYLWHANFPAGFPQQLAGLSLFRLAADLPHDLREMNGDQELDAHDYGYLADVLRAALADELPAAHRLRLARTLAWVEATAQP